MIFRRSPGLNLSRLGRALLVYLPTMVPSGTAKRAVYLRNRDLHLYLCKKEKIQGRRWKQKCVPVRMEIEISAKES